MSTWMAVRNNFVSQTLYEVIRGLAVLVPVLPGAFLGAVDELALELHLAARVVLRPQAVLLVQLEGALRVLLRAAVVEDDPVSYNFV